MGPPSYPNDERGTWILHNKIPGGHVGPDGVYSKGNPAKGGNWFYRQAGTPDTIVVIVDKEAYTEVKEHPAVTCEEPEVPVCGEEGHVPVGDECEEEEPPTDKPTENPTDTPTDKPESNDSDRCIGRPVIGGKCAPVEDKPEVGTSCTPTKCVRTNEDGSVEVTNYGNDVVEEGL